MTLTRREWLGGSALTVAWAASALPAFAQGAADYPTRDIKVISNFPPGNASDAFVRFYSERLGAVTARNIQVDNRPAAFGNAGNVAAAKAKPDGYTILITPATSTMLLATYAYKKLGYDPFKDLAPVTTLSKYSLVVLVDAKSPVKTLADLTAQQKSKSGKGVFGFNSNITLVTAELYNKLSGAGAANARYTDNVTMMNDLSSGQIDFIANDVPWAVEQIKVGKLRGLAVSGAARAAALPSIPTMEEAGVKGYGSIEPWWGVFVPAATPQPVVDKIEGWFNRIVASPEAQKFLSELGSESLPGSATMLKDKMAAESKRWSELVKIAASNLNNPAQLLCSHRPVAAAVFYRPLISAIMCFVPAALIAAANARMPQNNTGRYAMSTASNVARLRNQPSLRDRVSAAEWEARTDLAAAHRYAELSQWTDLIFNHFTMRVPGEPRHFLVKAHDVFFEEVTASNLLKVDVDGNAVGEDQNVNAAGFTIHTGIFKARDDVGAIAHVHSTTGMVLAAHKHGLRYLCQDAMMFYNRVSYHDFEGVAVDLDERERLGRNLGKNNVMVLRNHGLLTCGKGIHEAVILMHNLIGAAEVQARMEATGQEMCEPPPEVCEKTAQQFERFAANDSRRVQWNAILRWLDRRDPSYRD